MAIHASLLAIAEKATLLWATGIPNSDLAIITEAATNSSEEPGTSMGEITSQDPQTLTGALAKITPVGRE